ncbi:beta-ketoacyl synthase chain length factor [Vibrio mimicus]
MSNSYPLITINIENWYASSAGVQDKHVWQEWAFNGYYPEYTSSAFNNIPPMMRRRMSELSKHAVQCAIELLNQSTVDYLVFSSRHGELHRSVALVNNILRGEEASPMAFSQSVHNTAAGLTTIATNKPIPLTSIAAGENTFHSALLEVFCFLQLHPKAKVLLIDFDEPLPTDYSEFEKQSYRAYALGLILTHGATYSIQPATLNINPNQTLPQTLQFLKSFLSSAANQWQISTSRHAWVWHKK